MKCLTQPQDGCLRDYALSDWDLSVVAYDADAVVLAGRGLESFESSLYALGKDGPAVITAMTGAVLYNQGKTGGEETSHFETENPYYYLSIPGAMVMTEQICQGLAELYPDQGEIITENGEAARAKLENLRAECLEITGGCAGDHDAGTGRTVQRKQTGRSHCAAGTGPGRRRGDAAEHTYE